jgi:Leucine-rich repeat (LRR) protein
MQPCNGSSAGLTANDCSAWQRFSRDPLYKEWAEGKCGAKVHTDPCSCTFGDKVGCAKGCITSVDMSGQVTLPVAPSGGIPVVLLELTGLTFLNLGGTRLEGRLTSAIGKLTGLTYLSLYDTKLSGSIPSAIRMLTGLTTLSIGVNQLTGSMPQEMLDLKQLTVLTVNRNPQLRGLLPAFDFAHIKQCCSLTGDVFTCPLPKGVEKCVGGPGCGLHGSPKCVVELPCNGSSTGLTASDCNAWQRFSRDPLYKEWAEGKCGAKVHTDPCSCTSNPRVECAKGRIALLQLRWATGVTGGHAMPMALLDLAGLTTLFISNNRIVGSIPSAIGKLTGLINLHLNSNQFTGLVPAELVGLKHLTALNLQGNAYLTGLLPAFDFTKLGRCCIMEGDVFTCPLPPGADKCVGGPACYNGHSFPPPTCTPACNGTSSTLTANDCSAWQRFTRDPVYTKWAVERCGTKVHTDPCSCTFHTKVQCSNDRITQLDMHSQSLPVNGLPMALLALTGLTHLDLGQNNLGGTIPGSIAKLTALTFLGLCCNNLDGIPTTFGKLTGLVQLQLNSNRLNSTIPSTITELTRLTSLSFWDNQLNGPIPSAIGKLTGLTVLDLGHNDLSGAIPTAIGELTGLAYLSLIYNKLGGSIPSTIGKLTGLTSLTTYSNKLTGSIPGIIGQLTGLSTLWIGDNNLTGFIPTELVQLKQLTFLALQDNALTGKLPAFNFSQIAKCCALNQLDFTCPLPPGASTSCVGGASCPPHKVAAPTCK